MRDKIIALGLLTSVVPETLPGILIAALIWSGIISDEPMIHNLNIYINFNIFIH